MAILLKEVLLATRSLNSEVISFVCYNFLNQCQKYRPSHLIFASHRYPVYNPADLRYKSHPSLNQDSESSLVRECLLESSSTNTLSLNDASDDHDLNGGVQLA